MAILPNLNRANRTRTDWTQTEPLGIGGERRSRPNRIGSGALPDDHRSVDRWIEASAFVPIQTDPTRAGFTPNQLFGNSGVGILRGPAWSTWISISVSRSRFRKDTRCSFAPNSSTR